MNDYRINLNYAKALYLLASDLNQTKEVLDDMRMVNAVFSENHLLNTVLKNPTIGEAKKVAVVSDLFADKVSKTTLMFMHFVVRKRRAVNMKGISQMFMDIFRDENNIVLANVQTAVEINPEHLERIRREVAAFTKKTVEVNAVTNDAMLGGFRLSFDTYLYDARLYTKMAKLRKEFSKNVYESKL